MGWGKTHLCHGEVFPIYVPRFRIYAGSAHISLACRLKTYIIHGGSPPYSHTVYRNYYPRKFLNNLKPILPPDGVIRNPMLRTIDTVSQEKGMDLIKPEYVVKKILKNN